MSDSLFSYLQDKDWIFFKKFVKKNFVKSFVTKKKFNKFWFKKKKWSILIKKTKKNIQMLNMFLLFKAKFFKKKINICWTSTALLDINYNSTSVFGLSMLYLNKIFPITIMSCGNENSLPINKSLGKTIDNLKLRRFIFTNNIKCMQIIKSNKKRLFKERILSTKKINYDYELNQKLETKTPEDLNNLWSQFSSKLIFSIVKNYSYFKWRYEKAPFQKYYFLTFRDKKNNLLGVTVIRFQNTKFGICSRIVDFMSVNSKTSKKIWQGTILECVKKKSLFVDFIVFGTKEDKFLKSSGFILINKDLNLVVPNLLSPTENRDWTYSFHIGGYLSNLINKKHKNKIWFTKGDGDRDWPTPFDLKLNNS